VHDMIRLKKRIPLMFCSAKDEGNTDVKLDTYPSACYAQGIFRIGAAMKEGNPWPTVTSPQKQHFFSPGVDIKDVWGDLPLPTLRPTFSPNKAEPALQLLQHSPQASPLCSSTA